MVAGGILINRTFTLNYFAITPTYDQYNIHYFSVALSEGLPATRSNLTPCELGPNSPAKLLWMTRIESFEL